ncbi:hypothetical protein [Pedobacter endophyticus]|uniref:Uncharacterized protein n=1 Tax=Pedobacter endophyticus TaxID=2789740 RepID=A0A7U3Q3M3_9SPHI|nr:hypothetical protein [Pedobacter endophyticus]QPH37944.1 hypothetical protein IZT61_12595 [Pedobacter endophyticus]
MNMQCLLAPESLAICYSPCKKPGAAAAIRFKNNGFAKRLKRSKNSLDRRENTFTVQQTQLLQYRGC